MSGGAAIILAMAFAAAPAGVVLEDGAVVVRGPAVDRWAAADDAARAEALSVSVVGEGVSAPVVGEARVAGGALRFEPRFPFAAGARFSVTWDPTALGGDGARAVTVVATPSVTTPRARVTGFGPDTPTLAANTLRLYVWFDRPMRTDAVTEHVELHDDAGRRIDAPFFVAGRELWSSDGQRLTLLFDPGRVKSGLAAHDRLGRALGPGGAVRLVVKGSMPDATGRPIGATVTRRWAVGSVRSARIEPDRWAVRAPAAGTTQPFVIDLDARVDRVLLAERVSLVDGTGRPVAGRVAVAQTGDRWTLHPDRPWAAGRHVLRVDTTLEDHAGNSVASRFDRPATEPLRVFPGGVARRAVRIPER